MSKLFVTPFAEFGDRTDIQDEVQFDGVVSYYQGYGPDYERAREDPLYKPVPRRQMNDLFYQITNTLRDLQLKGFPDWSADATPLGGYPIGAVVRHLARNWQSLEENNTAEPPATGQSKWMELAAADIPDATSARKGLMRFATEFEIAQGIATNVAVTPADVKALVGDTTDFDRIAKPINTVPTNGALGVELTPTLTASGYMPIYSSDERLHRQFQLNEAGADGFDSLVFQGNIDADSITVSPSLSTATEYKWRCRDVSQMGYESEWSESTIFSTGSRAIITPSIVEPVRGSTDVPEQPIVKLSEFMVQGGTDTVQASRFRVRNSSGTVIHTSPDVTFGDKTEYAIPAGVLQEGTREYSVEGQYQGTSLGWSAWSASSNFFTSASFVPNEPGAPFGGGFFVALYSHPRKGTTALVDSGKAGEVLGLQWKTTRTSTTGTDSLIDGEANTQAMTANSTIKALHPAAAHCVDFRGGGYSDWHLPADLELELEYRFNKPTTAANRTDTGANQYAMPPTNNYTASNPAQTSVPAYRAGGAEAFETSNYYWSSSQYSASTAVIRIFVNGNRNLLNKDTTDRVCRPVRSVPIN